jgi:uncharacterized protein
MAPAELVTLAQQLIDDGRPFHAHEVLEAGWKSGPAAERELWRGLAQLAVGLTHARRGNAKGAVALLRRGVASLAVYHDAGPHGAGLHGAGLHGAGPHGAGPHGIDVAAAAQAADALAARIERYGLAGMDEADLRLRLRLAGR